MPNNEAYRIAEQKIEEARRSEATLLDLSGSEEDENAPRLSALPESIGRLPELQVLKLSRNHLTELPQSLWQLKALNRLELASNRFASLPPEIGNLTALAHLDLTNNVFKTLPPEIGNLTALVHLDLNRNAITKLPPEIGKLSALRNLYLGTNKLHAFPVEFWNLTALEYLSMFENKVKTLPPEIGQLTRLTSLGLRNNQLTTLPAEIGQLAALEQLYLHSNKLNALPPQIGQLASLQSITLDENQLTTLPSEMGRLTALKGLRTGGKLPLRHPPADVVELGAQAAVKYLRALWDGQDRVWESKVLLVGNGQEGKTWLYEALNGRSDGGRRRAEGATIGIHIGPLDVQEPGGAQQMHLQVWDFAGQDNNYATHQFFFSDRTLFLVVWSMRANWDDKKMRRWLQNIRDRSPGARVLLVGTQMDEAHGRSAPREFLKDFPQIVEAHEVSSTTMDGIPALRTALAREAATLPMTGILWPVKWRAAALAIRAMAGEISANEEPARPHASKAEVCATMLASGVQPEYHAVLLRWLHELGELLHYHEETSLAEEVILYPQWVTRRVGEVLASDIVKQSQGVLTTDCLNKIWPGMASGLREHLLAVMEKFDLAYRIPDDPRQRSVVVERLPVDRPQLDDKWPALVEKRQLRLRYKLGALHPGIPTWFIARCHRFTLGCHWLKGVLFEGKETAPETMALIEADEDRKTVEFTVRGYVPDFFLPLLRDGFEHTVRRIYPGMDMEPWVPCPHCESTQRQRPGEARIGALEERIRPKEQGREPKHRWECPECGKEHEIDVLLKAIHPEPAREIKLIEAVIVRTVAASEQRVTEVVKDEGAAIRLAMAAMFQAFWNDLTLQFIREWNKAQEAEEQSCPNFFAMYPVDGATLTKSKKLQIVLYCMEPGCCHAHMPDGIAHFQPTKESIKTVAKYVYPVAKIAHAICTPLKSTAALLAGGTDSSVKHAFDSYKLMLGTEGLAKELEDQTGPQAVEAPDEVTSDVSPSERGKPGRLGELATFLKGLTFKGGEFGGLKRVRTPENHSIWVCPAHALKYR